MSLYSQLSKADVQGGGAKIEEPKVDGMTQDFKVQLDQVLLQISRRNNKTLYIVEFTIIEGTEKNPPGAKRSWVQHPESRPMTDPGNIKAFAAAVIGVEGSDPDVPEQVFEDIENGKYNGKVLDLTVQKHTTGAGFNYWIHRWKPSQEPVRARPSKAGSPAPAVPPVPDTLTKDQWLAGKGPGKVHPQNSAYQYHPDHLDWGVRAFFADDAETSSSDRTGFSTTMGGSNTYNDDDIPF
jgi:hypothetical protein